MSTLKATDLITYALQSIMAFLLLPREIRNEIYRHVLFESEGLAFTVRGRLGYLTRRELSPPSRNRLQAHVRRFALYISRRSAQQKSDEHNQLKYVCRRMYEDTRGLEARFNHVVCLDDAPGLSVIRQGCILLSRCELLRCIAIRCSSLSFTSADSTDWLQEIFEHCSRRADLLVKIHLPCWSQHKSDFVRRGFAYLYTIRRDGRLLSELAKHTSVTFLSNSPAEMLTTDLPIPSNVRFFPWEEDYNAQPFHHSDREHQMYELSIASAVAGNVSTLALSWFASGI